MPVLLPGGGSIQLGGLIKLARDGRDLGEENYHTEADVNDPWEHGGGQGGVRVEEPGSG